MLLALWSLKFSPDKDCRVVAWAEDTAHSLLLVLQISSASGYYPGKLVEIGSLRRRRARAARVN